MWLNGALVDSLCRTQGLIALSSPEAMGVSEATFVQSLLLDWGEFAEIEHFADCSQAFPSRESLDHARVVNAQALLFFGRRKARRSLRSVMRLWRLHKQSSNFEESFNVSLRSRLRSHLKCVSDICLWQDAQFVAV